jgi:hypothetical protein
MAQYPSHAPRDFAYVTESALQRDICEVSRTTSGTSGAIDAPANVNVS